MAKRRATPESDEESASSEPTHASKRPRTANNSDVEEASSSRQDKQRKGKGRQNNNERDDDEMPSSTVANEEDEEKFEQENGDKIAAAIQSKRRNTGSVADHGIIESIEMYQFMCHKYLTFQFGPQINFIIGHNGSGKSAVLSAITVVLGGKANSTGRGNGLKSFIREGQSAAEVTISLKNQGDEAYKPNEYGKSIVITRKFTKEGNSSWKIKSKSGQLISTKKDELSAICDHMNIQVDNPMNILTQDSARQFLSASHPSDKYKFFLRGTQLSQLSAEYTTCLDNITQTSKLLALKKGAIPELKTAFRDASIRFEEANKAREQRKKADDLKKELAWSHVRGKEEEMALKIEDAAKISRRLPKIKANVAEAQAKFEQATEAVRQLEQEFRDLGDMGSLNEKKDALQAKIRVNKAKLTEFNAEITQMDTSLKALKAQIEGYDKQIAEETRRLETHTQAKREETQRKLDAARQAVERAQGVVDEVLKQKRSFSLQCDAAKAEGEVIETELGAIQKKLQDAQETLRRCQASETNSLAPYGQDIRGVLERIKTMRWHGDPPLGPLGIYVSVKDQKWGEVLRSQLGGFLLSFALTDTRDRPQLKELLRQTQNHRTQIIIYEKDLFDYSHGEPQGNVLTVLRALEISDPYVLRILINVARIERQLLAPSRLDGERQLKQMGGGGSVWTAEGFQVRVFSEGGSSSNPLTTLRSSDSRSRLLRGRDVASEIRHQKEVIEQLELECKNAKHSREEKRAVYIDCRRAIDKLSKEESVVHEKLRLAKVALVNLQQEANEELPANMAGLNDAKQEAQAEKESIAEQFANVVREKAKVDEVQKGLLIEMNALRQQIGEFEQKRGAAGTLVENAGEERLKQQNRKNHYEGKLREEEANLAKAEEVARVLQTEFENWTAKAEEFCERVPQPRKTEEVQRNLDSVNKALKEREKRQGASVEEMTIAVNKARMKLDAAEKEYKHMSTLNKALKESLIVRLSRWQEFRRHIALRCKLVFQYHLSQRGFYGKVLFDHVGQTLALKVQTDDQVGTQGARDKDPRSLSGGEKSFSTICLLLSLWESIGCPLRCLDEFDVYMDAVNRRISMKMMIDTANSSDKKQYILITPQDMGNIQIGNTIKVLRMRDPERGQGVLAFNAG